MKYTIIEQFEPPSITVHCYAEQQGKLAVPKEVLKITRDGSAVGDELDISQAFAQFLKSDSVDDNGIKPIISPDVNSADVILAVESFAKKLSNRLGAYTLGVYCDSTPDEITQQIREINNVVLVYRPNTESTNTGTGLYL